MHTVNGTHKVQLINNVLWYVPFISTDINSMHHQSKVKYLAAGWGNRREEN